MFKDERRRGTRWSAKFSEASLEEEEGSKSNDWLRGSKGFCELRTFSIFAFAFCQTFAHLTLSSYHPKSYGTSITITAMMSVAGKTTTVDFFLVSSIFC